MGFIETIRDKVKPVLGFILQSRIIEWPYALYHFLGFAGFFAFAALVAVLGSVVIPTWFIMTMGLATGVVWELIEMRWERKYGTVPEHPLNRWVTDLVCDLLGTFVGWALMGSFAHLLT